MQPSPPPRPFRWTHSAQVVRVVAAVLMVTSAAYAAVTLTYNTASTETLSLKSPPIKWQAGPDSSGNNFVASWTLSNNATYYTVTLKSVPEGNVTWGNLSTLKNVDTVAYSVTVTGTSVSANAKILDFKMQFFNYGTNTLRGTLNLKDASPSASLGSMAASAQVYAKTWIKLDTGTSAPDIPASVTISLSIS